MSTITIVGLGPGDPSQLTRAAWEILAGAEEVWLRTARHPTVAGFPQALQVHSFDALYETLERPEQVYQAIAEQVLSLGARPQGVIYAVPGHPHVAEAAVQLIRQQAPARGLTVRLVAGLSFVEPALEALGVDALPQLQLADALELAGRHHPPFHPDAPALVAQLYSAGLASDVKLTLMNQYPDEHHVWLVHAAGTADARLEELPLYAIDRSPQIAHLTALYVPPLPRPSALETFQETIAHLRAPEGCPWDREQTHQTLRRNLLEETYEVLHALDADDPEAMREEFGDLLLQIVLHAQIATEAGEYSLADVIADIQAKIIRRHPHVFGEVKVAGAADVVKNWELLKAEERKHKPQPAAGGLGEVPRGLPALAQAETYQKRAARVGFDWPEVAGVRAKVDEELAEVAEADTPETRHQEVGDLLFAVVNWARWLEVEPESALREANARFAARFTHMATAAQAQGRPLSALSLEELDGLWEQAKRALAGDAD
ncbi:MAG: nucleoside triphosphate pyrophosphohydrolase [Anaerolineales bacterium]|nr:nucleoside triphosphate pyrophosphohydrolase [Anaerolineales bacterium]